jgi:FkbM family methyltransferase
MNKRIFSQGKRRLHKAREMWHFLKTQEAFRRAPALTLLRSVIWYWRCLLRVSTVLELPRWSVRMLFPAERKGFGKFIYTFREYYEPELAYLEKILSPGSVFVDVGANFGVYTLVASKLVGETGKVIAFEPTAQSFAILRQNIELNHFSNARAFQVALAQTRRRAWLNYGWDPVGNWVGDSPGGNEGEEVQTEALDHLLEENGIDRVHAIKIDVEGAEELVLRGAITCLTTQSPIVIFEFNPACAARLGLSPLGARDFLRNLGYRFVVLGDCAKSKEPALQPSYFNMVAIPNQSARNLSDSVRPVRGQTQILESKEFSKG